MRVDEVGQQFDLDLEHEDVDSVSGLVLTLLGRTPQVGDSVRYERLLFEVTAVKGHGVDECGGLASMPMRLPQRSADVNPWPLQRVGLRLPEHFARDRRGVPLAERQELQQVGDRIPFGPAEVGVRDLAGLVACSAAGARRSRSGSRG